MSDFKVKGQLGLDGSGFFSTLGKAEGAVGKLGGMLAGAFSVGAIVSFSKSVLDLAGNLNDVSEALGLNVEFLQKFVNSAAKSGGSMADVEKFIFESNKSRQDALDKPDGANAKAFQSLGFTQNDISKLSPQAFIEKLIEAFQDGASAQDINALAEIGGKSAKKLVGAFKEGLDEATAIMNADVVAQLDEIGDKFTSIGNTLKATFAPVLTAVADSLQGFLNQIAQDATFLGEVIGSLMAGRGLKEGLADARAAVKELKNEQNQRANADAKARAAARAAKEMTDSASPDFKASEEDPQKTAKTSAGRGIYSDSRLAVGGFLGSGVTTSLSSIAEKQLRIQTQTLSVQQQILQAVKTVNPVASLVIPS